MTGWVIDIVDSAGYLGLFGLMLLECVFPPIPSEAILPFAGFVVAQGDMNYLAAVAAATAGSMVGNLLLYAAGRFGGQPLVERHGRRVGATPERIAAFDRWMLRWGTIVILAARAVPLARTAISVPAGLAAYPVGRFAALTLIGSLIWNGALIGAGWALDDAWREVERTLGPISIAVVGAMVVTALVGIAVLRRRARRRRPGAAGPTGGG
jgi:membrane protein DedA with SNARE-associated domain